MAGLGRRPLRLLGLLLDVADLMLGEIIGCVVGFWRLENCWIMEFLRVFCICSHEFMLRYILAWCNQPTCELGDFFAMAMLSGFVLGPWLRLVTGFFVFS